MTIVDIYCHIYPDRFFREMTEVAPKLENIGKRLRGVTKLFDLDARFKEMDEFGDYQQILSLSNPPIENLGTPDKTPAIARLANDALAKLCRAHPDRFPAFIASLPMNNPDAAVREAERAIGQLGARGVQVFTNVLGKPLSGPDCASGM